MGRRIVRVVSLFLFFLMTSVNLAEGADIAAGKAQAAACAGRHGADGQSAQPAVPNLGGQQEAYLLLQLQAFKEGGRKSDMMNSLSAGLNEREMRNLAAYYASLKPMTSRGDRALAARGRAKFSLCIGCHGVAGAGQGGNPRLAGQQPLYTARELMSYRDGSRQNPIMNGIAAGLTENDIKALAEYVATLK